MDIGASINIRAKKRTRNRSAYICDEHEIAAAKKFDQLTTRAFSDLRRYFVPYDVV
jgi:predicted RNA-binding protein YlxR (DUF448 family)